MATIRRGVEEAVVPVSELQAGDIVVVKPGARIPVDGVVTAGASSVNQAPITGEFMPVEKFLGSTVFSGTLNESGRLDIRTEKVGEETTLAKIVHLVQEAQGTRAPIQNLADRFTTWFLPLVILLAILAFFTSGNIKVAVSVLLVACPCAFAIATPLGVELNLFPTVYWPKNEFMSFPMYSSTCTCGNSAFKFVKICICLTGSFILFQKT